MLSRSRFVVQAAMLVALSIAVRRLLTPHVHGLNLGGFPIILAGFILGPVGGAVVGALSDVVGFWFGATGAYSPLFTLSAALTGTLPVAFLQGLGRTRSVPWWLLAAAIAVGQVTTKGLLVPLFEHALYGTPLLPLVARGISAQVLHVPLYAVLAVPVLAACAAAEIVSPVVTVAVGRR